MDGYGELDALRRERDALMERTLHLESAILGYCALHWQAHPIGCRCALCRALISSALISSAAKHSDGSTPMQRVFGKWPGNETDEQIAAALSREPDAAGMEEAVRVVRDFVTEVHASRLIGFPGNAPGHGHIVPGVWDVENGPPQGGTACALCLAWRRMVALLNEATSGQRPCGVDGK